MKQPLKLAIYSGEIPSTTFIERLIKGVAATGHNVLLFGVKNRKPQYHSKIEVLGYRNNKLAKLFYLWRYTLLLLIFKYEKKQQLDRLLKIDSRISLYAKVKYYPVLWYEPDIFHIQWAKGLAEWLWVQDFGMKLVLSLRGAHINYSPLADEELASMYKQNFPRVDGFHAVSKAIGLEAQKYGAPANRIHTVYSGLPEMKAALKIKSEKGPFKIVSVGRPHWKKGYNYALDACKILQAAGVTFSYTIVGGAHAIELQYYIHDSGLTNQVTLLEQQPFEIVQELMLKADLFLLPSVEEGIANVVLEAMALGTLVLSTNCGGMSEVITDGENGFIVPIRNSIALADKIRTIQNLTPSARQRIIHAAHKTILEQNTETIMVDGMLSLYNEVLNTESL